MKRFAFEHFPPEPTRVEWIDDTSANIEYPSAELASEALVAFSDGSALGAGISDFLALRKAKTLSSHPHAELTIRPALITELQYVEVVDLKTIRNSRGTRAALDMQCARVSQRERESDRTLLILSRDHIVSTHATQYPKNKEPMKSFLVSLDDIL